MSQFDKIPDKDSIFKVSEITSHIKNIIEENIPNLYIEGEISNLTHHNSGHIYLTLKDEKSSIRCVFFRSYNQYLSFKPKTGDNVICLGKVTVYERGGNYQLNIMRMISSGKGSLDEQFEKLKQQLSEEGLFSPDHKKNIPEYPQVIGVVTSATGAAIQDIYNVISRRYPCRILLFPATVQGPKAAAEVIEGIRYFNREKNVDTIIIGRGGGSQEDLFCFNDEQLAREIYSSEIPIISAVGHEIDFTISDFVADLRAPTPSAAAELAVPESQKIIKTLEIINHRISASIRNRLYSYRLSLSNSEHRIHQFHPENIIRNYQQQLDEAKLKLDNIMEHRLEEYRQNLNLHKALIESMSPYNALKRGYSIIRQEQKILNSVENIDKRSKLEVLMQDGSLECSVDKVVKNI